MRIAQGAIRTSCEIRSILIPRLQPIRQELNERPAGGRVGRYNGVRPRVLIIQ